MRAQSLIRRMCSTGRDPCCWTSIPTREWVLRAQGWLESWDLASGAPLHTLPSGTPGRVQKPSWSGCSKVWGRSPFPVRAHPLSTAACNVNTESVAGLRAQYGVSTGPPTHMSHVCPNRYESDTCSMSRHTSKRARVMQTPRKAWRHAACDMRALNSPGRRVGGPEGPSTLDLNPVRGRPW